MTDPKKGTEFVCDVCGTTLLVTDDGIGVLEDIVCCAKPMATRASKPRKTKPKKKAAKKKKK